MTKRIAIATSADWPGLLPEELPLLDAFRAAGLEAQHDPEGPMGRGLYLATAA